MIVSIIRKKFQPSIYKLVKWFHRKPRRVNKRGIEFILQPTVFHPDYYKSTDYLLDFILQENLANKNVLELGCGSGFISMYLSKECRANVVASDINPNAVSGLKENALKLNLEIKVVESDLFDNLGSFPTFDYILVNPPYFQKEINSLDEYAFFTGQNHTYFEKFFDQVKIHLQDKSKVYCVLSENVKLEELRQIAIKYAIDWKQIESKIISKECFIILNLYLL